MIQRALIAAACLVAAAAPLHAAEAPADYRKIVVAKLPTLLPASVKRGEVEISPLRPAPSNAPTPWVTCLTIDARGTPQRYALFIDDHDVVDVRLAVAIDQCDRERYTALTPPSARKRKRR